MLSFKHAYTHRWYSLTPITHTYNILPGFESICGPAQSPLHKLFVTNERARGLLLWWSSERIQLYQWERRKQHWRLKALILYVFLILTPKTCTLSLFPPKQQTYTRTYTVTADGLHSWYATHKGSPAEVDIFPLCREKRHPTCTGKTTLIPKVILGSPCRRSEKDTLLFSWFTCSCDHRISLKLCFISCYCSVKF